MIPKEKKLSIELSIDEQTFLLKWLPKTYLSHMYNYVEIIEQAATHPECDQYIIFEIPARHVEALIGELSYEANHNPRLSH